MLRKPNRKDRETELPDTRVVRTERLTLRPVGYRDVFSIKREFDYALTRFMSPAPAKTLWEELRVVRKFKRTRRKGIEYVYAVTDRETGEFYGIAGLHGLKNAEPKFGIWTKRSAHGRHIGREAVGGLKDLAARLGYAAALYPVDRRNAASRKIPESFGGTLLPEPDGAAFRPETSGTGRGLEIVVYRVPLSRNRVETAELLPNPAARP